MKDTHHGDILEILLSLPNLGPISQLVMKQLYHHRKSFSLRNSAASEKQHYLFGPSLDRK